MELVSVLYEFEYKARDGRLVSIKPEESYILVSKTNEHWWHVRKDKHTKPFYVPAQYMKQLSVAAEGGRSPNELNSSESPSRRKSLDMTSVKPPQATKANHVSCQDSSRGTHRFSTFGFCDDVPDVKPCEPLKNAQTASSFAQTLGDKKGHTSTGGTSVTSETLNTEGLYARPHPVAKVKKEQPHNSVQEEAVVQTFVNDGDGDDMDFPPPPPNTYDTIPEINVTDFDTFPELPEFVDSPEASASQQQRLNPAAEGTFSSDAPHSQKVENENLRSAVYVNVAQLRQSISESPPSAPSSCSPSGPDQEEWEVHVDQDSGQEYYYHPSTGRTTWDNPFVDSPTDPEPPPPAEQPRSPSPPQSPARSLSTASPTAWTSDWEQLVDETSGRPYFYNPMSGETSWEPPEPLSPYPTLMEPMSVHRFHEDGPPPLPEEDYPPEDYPPLDQPEPEHELHAMGPPTLPKEYALGHAGRTIIPRAALDRSTPTGWNLNVEPNGTWVFTSENSPDQWIKSVDDRGQTYYYLRDGSKSQWSLPEAPVAYGHSRMENGVESDSVSVIKNWRHTMGPAQFSSGQDDGRFVPTHKRNTSDYSSDSSSTGNSPETQHNVQNLEKAGILNKTKVSENGKKVRKNWSQTWTVLHGGVLTFHKDPKSAATGASNKTNQIVPEVTVDLRGATIAWASKDKSSKKNVLELKGKNGVEFLVQYDTESIINDWHKVLVDTIRQLEYQDHHSEEEDGDLYEKIGNVEREDKPGPGAEKRRASKPVVTPISSSAGDTDPKKVRTKLMKFLMKRPTLQSVKEKGYIRENVFGCHLATLCAQEKTTVPGFVEKCVKAVERRGLDIDGLYRVSGNLAIIQKLRFKADHEELDLEDGQWEDVHVITGALKLFFRELPEPLFPYSHFNKFIAAIRIPDYHSKLSCMYELVRSLPAPNHDTMELLFGHLHRVIEYGEDNRMTVQNVAIVFGPTLLRPEMESSNIAMHMVFQNQIVEFILNEYERIFHSS
ncbi:rho GTPase-activating protein 12 isoform X2 [Mugil cephalus]|uniref:rho GTPase-activating protein 12 isoform X2 n=1 Tax=Mugil cephalus TaxID=48193 RepID=UPI001FB7AFFB|nr:rho GTPase-activating protein 12 isoform X2 [Mugil cephalus]